MKKKMKSLKILTTRVILQQGRKIPGIVEYRDLVAAELVPLVLQDAELAADLLKVHAVLVAHEGRYVPVDLEVARADRSRRDVDMRRHRWRRTKAVREND